jgi:hypothetical protein
MNTIRNKVRYLLGDTSTSGSDILTYDTDSVFTLSEENVITVSTVLKNNVAISSASWSYNSTTNKVTVTTSLLSGDIIEIKYTYYPNYSDTELTNYVQAALVHLGINNYYDFQYDTTDDDIYPTPSIKEQNLIATITSILINPDNRTYRLPDITINIPNDLPTSDKISKTIAVFKHNSHGIFDILY